MIRPLWLRRILRPFDRLPKTDRRGPHPAPREPLEVGDRVRWHDDDGPVDGTVVVAGPVAHIECDDGSRVFAPDGRPGGRLERMGRRVHLDPTGATRDGWIEGRPTVPGIYWAAWRGTTAFGRRYVDVEYIHLVDRETFTIVDCEIRCDPDEIEYHIPVAMDRPKPAAPAPLVATTRQA